MSIQVNLSPNQQTDSRVVGRFQHDRYERVVESHYRTDPGTRAAPLRWFINAAAAEIAVSVVTGEHWNRGDILENVWGRKADVGDINEVRWSGRRVKELKFYDPDQEDSQDRGHEDRRFWLVYGYSPRPIVHGWLTGRDCMRLGERRKEYGRWAYWVPAHLVPELFPRRRFPPRLCPSCLLRHPVLTTCAGGWAPWDGKS